MIMAGAALAYWLIPTDLLPDLIPALGQIDDIIIGIITVINLLQGMANDHRLEDKANGETFSERSVQ